jgi:hypothetical protein
MIPTVCKKNLHGTKLCKNLPKGGGGETKRREIGEIEPATETKCRVETQREKSINKWLKKMED